MSITNSASADDLITCPYDSVHQIQRKKFQNHLVKCKKNYPDIELGKCPFNIVHLMPVEKLPEHVASCPDKGNIFIYKEPDQVDFAKATVSEQPKNETESEWSDEEDNKPLKERNSEEKPNEIVKIESVSEEKSNENESDKSDSDNSEKSDDEVEPPTFKKKNYQKRSQRTRKRLPSEDSSSSSEDQDAYRCNEVLLRNAKKKKPDINPCDPKCGKNKTKSKINDSPLKEPPPPPKITAEDIQLRLSELESRDAIEKRIFDYFKSSSDDDEILIPPKFIDKKDF